MLDNVPTLASRAALGSPPQGLLEISQPLAASPWLANSVLENKFKYEFGRDGAHAGWPSPDMEVSGSLQVRKRPTSVPQVAVWISVAFSVLASVTEATWRRIRGKASAIVG